MSRYSPASSAAVVPNKWTGKKAVTMGDSITFQNRWQPYLTSILGLTIVNKGISGTRIADLGDTGGTSAQSMCRDERINDLDSDADLIIVMGGTNDWAQNVALGTYGSVDVTTFNGALMVMANKLMARFPTKRVVLLSTPYGKYPNRAGWTDTYGLKNNLNLTTVDYAKAVVDFGRNYGLPVIDVNSQTGWNDSNILNYTDADGASLHPNVTLGAKRLAEVVVGGLRDFEPVS